MIMSSKHPDMERCLRYLEDYGTPAHVVGHCKAVADTACRIGRALNEAGGTMAPPISEITFRTYEGDNGHMRHKIDQTRTIMDTGKVRLFDLALTQAAGLLHDMARVEDRHWDAAADFCRDEGLYEESKIIRVHMQYEFTTDAWHLTEADLVCLGDRLVLEDYYAGIDKRMDYIIAKAERQGHLEAGPVILKKKEETKVLLRQIEDRIGCSLDEIMPNAEDDR